jgi:hypothetical protein
MGLPQIAGQRCRDFAIRHHYLQFALKRVQRLRVFAGLKLGDQPVQPGAYGRIRNFVLVAQRL